MNGDGTAGTGANPSGTWATGSGNWNTSSTGTGGSNATWTDWSAAVFSAGTNGTGSYTVGVSGTVGISSLTIEEGSPTFSGGTIQFDGDPNFSVASGLIATVNSVVEQVLAFREKTGPFGTLLYPCHDWVDPALGKRSMQLMAEEVMPRVNAALGEAA